MSPYNGLPEGLLTSFWKRKKSKHRKLRNTDRNGEDSRLNGDQFIHVNQAVEENDLNYTTHASLTNSTNEVNEQSIEMLNVKNNDDTKWSVVSRKDHNT